MRTDTIFYQLFQTFPTLLFELIGQPPEQGDRYEFSSREIIVYLDELQMPTSSSIGMGTVQLVVGDDETAVSQAKQLVENVRREFEDAAIKLKVVELIETILVYKLPHLTRKEIEAMFELEDLKNTRYFQDVATEALEEGRLQGELQGKLESVAGFLDLGLTVEQISGALKLDVEMVRQAGQNQEAIATSEAEGTGI